MSTQEQAVPKRRSSRGATANRRSASQRAAAATTSTPAANATPTSTGRATASIAPETKAVAAGRATGAETAARSDRAARKSQQQQETRRGVLSSERFEPVRRFTRDTVAEIKKVNWPDQQTTRNLTIVVVAVSAALGLLLGGLDFALLKLFEALP